VDYVGLALTKGFDKHYSVKVFDKDEHGIKKLQKGIDRNFNIRPNDLKLS